MSLLSEIKGPRDLDSLNREQLTQVCAEIREHLINSVARTGGHLGPNLGVVETTVAIHRVFDSPNDPIIFDTGHQSYVHKLLTGRQDFSRLRQKDGIAGYPQRSESVHDVVESSHASSSLSWADGIAKAFKLTQQNDRHVVAVIGDGALTGGMAWEALNNITDDNDRKLVIVVNDNGRSYAPTIGGLARYLNDIRTEKIYRKAYQPYIDYQKKVVDKVGRTDASGIMESSDHLANVLQDVPALVIPCGLDRVSTDAIPANFAGYYGSLLPAVWSFMLACRSRELGTAYTTLHLNYEKEAAELLGIPDTVTQLALIPVAYYTGDDFKPAKRLPVEKVTYFNGWKNTL